MNTTINWLVSQNIIEGFHWITGNKSGLNEITCVNIMDNPDTIRWFKGGELVLSTGYLMKEDSTLRKNLIRELHAKGCAGLGIKLKRYFDVLPDEMIEQANELNFPIIQIPYESTMAEISKLIYNNIFQTEMSEQEKITQMYRDLNSMVMREHGLSDTLKTIINWVKYPVILTNNKLELIEYEAPEDFNIPLSNFLHLDFATPILPSSFINNINEDYNKRHFVLSTIKLESQSSQVDLIIFPITEEKSLKGFCCYLDLNSTFSSSDYNFAFNANSIMSIELMKYDFRLQRQKDTKNDFLQSILTNSMTQQELISLCEFHGFNYQCHRICSVIRLDNYIGKTFDQRKSIENQLQSIIRTVLSAHRLNTFKINYNNNIVIYFFFLLKSKTSTAMIDETTQCIKRITDELNAAGINCASGIGKITTGIQTIGNNFSQALSALRVGADLHKSQTVFSYHDDAIYHLLLSNFTKEQLMEIYTETIEPLVTFDKENNLDWIDTLKEYFSSGFNITEAAKQLYIHRNTMNYRMEKIRELLNTDLKNTNECLMLQLGLIAMELLYS